MMSVLKLLNSLPLVCTLDSQWILDSKEIVKNLLRKIDEKGGDMFPVKFLTETIYARFAISPTARSNAVTSNGNIAFAGAVGTASSSTTAATAATSNGSTGDNNSSVDTYNQWYNMYLQFISSVISISSRRQLENYLDMNQSLFTDVTRFKLSKGCYSVIDQLGISHQPYKDYLKAIIADLVFKDLRLIEILLNFTTAVRIVLKKEVLALIQLAFIKTRQVNSARLNEVHESQTGDSETETRTTSTTPNETRKQHFFELLVTKAGVIGNRVAPFVIV